jgi:lactoylglutathione lyase
MTIAHVALWTGQLERSREFYAHWFGGVAGANYTNAAKGFSSYFLRFESGAALELMQRSGIAPRAGDAEHLGYAHLAFATGGESAVRDLTERMRAAGVPVLGEPRWTGDGYYESVVTDPDGNRIEITV